MNADFLGVVLILMLICMIAGLILLYWILKEVKESNALQNYGHHVLDETERLIRNQ
jgi:hypothetical protein